MVDMVTTRKSDFGRILVAVLDPALLPSSMDVVIGDHYFELKIEKEKVGFDDIGDEVELDFGENGDDGDGKEEEENNADRDAKRARPVDAMEEDNGDEGDGTADGTASLGDGPALENKLKSMAQNIIDMAVDKVMLECADNVLAETDLQLDGQVEEVFSANDDVLDLVGDDPVADSEHLGVAGQVSEVIVTPRPLAGRLLEVGAPTVGATETTGGLADGMAASVGFVQASQGLGFGQLGLGGNSQKGGGGAPGFQNQSPDGEHSSDSPPAGILGVGTGGADFDHGSSGCGSGGLVTHADATLAKAASVRATSTAVHGAAGVGAPAAVVAAAAVEEVRNTPKRSSPRLAKHNDDDSIQKAKKRAAWKNLDFSGGNTTDLSFIPFSVNEISSHVSALGVSVGNNPNLVVDSVNLLKDIELSRLRAEPSSTDVFSKNNLLSDEEDNELENIALGHLCGDLMDEVMDDDRIFWNSRGLSDLAKNRFLSDLSKEQKLDFIALLETGKKDFSKTVLNNICGGQEFIWHWIEPHVYGAAQVEHKESSLAELVQTCAKETGPVLVGGDFNIIRNPQEKNNGRYEDRWPFLFNAIIDSLDLRELDLSNRKYTWANNRETPTYERLDRILVSTEWESKFPLATVQALTREISYHTPLLLDTADELDKKVELQTLSSREINLKNFYKERLALLLREEELKWYQRANTTKLLSGDCNTKYFHLVANGKHRKTRIFRLEQEEGTITGDENLKKFITNYYKGLFGEPDSNNFSMIESFIDDIAQVSQLENDVLTAEFSEKEVRAAIFQMEHNKAPGSDGFPAEFYQVFWELIKHDFMPLFNEFHKGSLPLFSLNFGIITLLPKQKEATQIQQFRPICLLNVSFKIFTKVLTNRIALVAQKVIQPSQSVFMKGRNILEGVVILHETIHEMHRKKLDGVILKLDFEKAYDKVKWSFLQQTLRMKGFSPRWCKWIDQIVRGGSVSVKVNDDVGNFFQTKKGLRQGDPLSPILFNLVADMLTTLIFRAKSNGKFKRVVPHLVEDGLSILQYADDTILFLDHDMIKAKDLKLVLSTFEQLSGLKINFHKSELFCYGAAKDCEQEYTQLFGCKVGGLPFRYLGIPMNHKKLSNKDWAHIEDKFQKKLSSWKGKLFSVGGRLVLINSVLTSLAMFMLSFLEVPRGILQKLDYYRSCFFWQCDDHKKKYRLARWSVLCKPKDFGGLGIQNLDLQNKCLLSKWLFRLINEDGVWQRLLRKKYLPNKTLTQVQHRPGDSHFWSGLLKVKDDFLAGGCFKVQSGEQVRFWKDIWLGDKPLREAYPNLFRIVKKKYDTVANVLRTVPLNVSFRRGLVIFRATYWIRQWSLVHKMEERLLFKRGCRDLETMLMAVFAKFGWCFRNRIEA
ncbi:uncharacterized protein LOC133892218 [Phragmites australis]|uniref:uncharacterized protein LOC133892218 n=1 Tax=Phragmites australis TaxID=29695 RepID=UPI002D799EE4|nr:uncharacterized protein LOC133892218 [Phragmites australis]